MSLVLSPHSLEMSTTTSSCATPIVEAVHVSPRLHPPPQIYHKSNGCDLKKTYSRNDQMRGSKQGLQIDPFLSQYLKHQQADVFHITRKFLSKQVHAKDITFYENYLQSHNFEASTPNSHIRKSLVDRKQLFSLQNNEKVSEQTNGDEQMMDEDPLLTSRRRRFTGSGHSTPLAPSKKVHSKVITKCLPEEFMQCDIDDLVTLISRMLQSLINLNDRSVPESIANPSHPDASNTTSGLPDQRNKLLTRYHSRSPPAISIQTYLARLTKFNNFSQATLLTTIYYIDLLSHNYQPYFTLNSWTVHRFLLVATMLGQKALEDYFYTNDHYAKVGGVALTELNCLELDFLDRVDWKLVPAKQILSNKTSIKYYKEVLGLYYVQLVNLMEKNNSDNDNVVYTLSPQLSKL